MRDPLLVGCRFWPVHDLMRRRRHRHFGEILPCSREAAWIAGYKACVADITELEEEHHHTLKAYTTASVLIVVT